MKKLIIAMCLIVLTGCTEQSRVKTFGGTTILKLPKGQKLITITWKDSDIWYLTKEMKRDEQPEQYRFTEESNLGIANGELLITETR